MHLVIFLSHEVQTCKIFRFQTGWDYAGHLDRLSGRGILSKLSGLSRKNRDGWSPYTRVQRHVRRTWNMNPPDHKTLLKWDRTLRETGSLLPKTGKHAKVSVNEETIERVRTAFARSPRKSIRRASTELQIPRSTIQKIIHKRLHLSAFKIQLRHHIKPNDRPLRVHFAAEMLLRIENDNSYLDNIVFSDEVTFPLCGKINKHNCRIWGSENPHVIHEQERDTPKVNVWCGLARNSVIGPFFLIEATVTGHVAELCY